MEESQTEDQKPQSGGEQEQSPSEIVKEIKEAYEKQIKELKDQLEKQKKEHLQEMRDLVLGRDEDLGRKEEKSFESICSKIGQELTKKYKNL